jgi:hypothetical protein
MTEWVPSRLAGSVGHRQRSCLLALCIAVAAATAAAQTPTPTPTDFEVGFRECVATLKADSNSVRLEFKACIRIAGSIAGSRTCQATYKEQTSTVREAFKTCVRLLPPPGQRRPARPPLLFRPQGPARPSRTPDQAAVRPALPAIPLPR